MTPFRITVHADPNTANQDLKGLLGAGSQTDERRPRAVPDQGNGTQAIRCPSIIWITSPRMMTGRLLRDQFDPPTSSNRGRSDMCHRYSRQRRGLRCVPSQQFLIGLRFTGRMNLVIGLNRFVPAGTRATAFYYSMPLTVRP